MVRIRRPLHGLPVAIALDQFYGVSIRFTPGGEKLVVVLTHSGISELMVLDRGTGRVLADRVIPGVNGVAVASDGTLIAVGTGNDIEIYDTESSILRRVQTLRGHTEEVVDVSFGAGGRELASIGRDSTLRVWDVATGTERYQVVAHTRGGHTVAYSPDGRTIVTGGDEPGRRWWRADTGDLLMEFNEYSRSHRMEFSPDGRRLAEYDYNGQIAVYDRTPTGPPRWSGLAPDAGIRPPPR